MKIIKNTFLVLATAVIMTSCKTSITTIPVPAGSSQAVVATGKKAERRRRERVESCRPSDRLYSWDEYKKSIRISQW